MAALDFPLVPNTESEVTTGDITWKWNGYAWYATSQAGDVFLSKVNDDTAAGAITFKALTTHEAGVSVTGGDDVGTGLGFVNNNLKIVNNGSALYLQDGKSAGFRFTSSNIVEGISAAILASFAPFPGINSTLCIEVPGGISLNSKVLPTLISTFFPDSMTSPFFNPCGHIMYDFSSSL